QQDARPQVEDLRLGRTDAGLGKRATAGDGAVCDGQGDVLVGAELTAGERVRGHVQDPGSVDRGSHGALRTSLSTSDRPSFHHVFTVRTSLSVWLRRRAEDW